MKFCPNCGCHLAESERQLRKKIRADWLAEQGMGSPKFDHAYQVMGAYARINGIPLTDLVGISRTNHIAWMRQMAVYVMRELSGLSFPQLGACFNRDHSTMIYAYGKVQRRKNKQAGFALELMRMMNLIKAELEAE